MAILILFICFILFFLILGVNNGEIGKGELLLRTVLLFSLLLAIITELLGAFKFITFQSLAICWSFIAIVGICYLFTKKTLAAQFISNFKTRPGQIYRLLTPFEQLLLTATFILFLLEFAQGIIYPPNTLDSLTYHVARLASWISHHSVSPYPTYIPRQLYQPPLAEYVILNINLLGKSDYFSATVQFFAQLFCLVGLVLIGKQLGLGRKYLVITFVIGATIPEVVLQASSTQNDVVVAFFVIAAFYFFIKSIKSPGIANYLFLGLSAGLGMFTKGTAYLFIAPILLIFGIAVLIKTFNEKQYKSLLYALLLTGLLPVSINFIQYYRNYSYSGNILGVDQHESNLYGNNRMSPALFICNTAKDVDLNMELLCVPRITFAAGKVVHKIFKLTKVDINDPAITYPHTSLTGIPGDTTYFHGRMVTTHEDYSSDFIDMLLIWVSLGIIGWAVIKYKTNQAVILLSVTVVIQVIFFCAYLKWQPWGIRLQTSMFLLSSPLICCAAVISNRFYKVLQVVVLFMVGYAFLLVVFNCIRPYVNCSKIIHGYFITANGSVFEKRGMKLFLGDGLQSAYSEYNAINNDIKKSNYKNIGLILADEGREYPLFTDCYTRELNPVHVLLNNYTKNIGGYGNDVDCIVSTTEHKLFIDYKAKRFYNQNIKNQSVWYYKPL